MARAFVTRPVHSPMEAHDLVIALLGSGLAPAAIELDLPIINPGLTPPPISRPAPGRRSMPGGSLAEKPTARLDPSGRGDPNADPGGRGNLGGNVAGNFAGDPAARLGHPVDPGRTQRPGRPTTTGTVAVLLEGSTAGVKSRAADASLLMRGGATTSTRPPDWWGRYPFDRGDVALKIATPIADLYAALYALRDAAGFPVSVRGSAGVGVCYASLPGAPEEADGAPSAGRDRSAKRHVAQIADVVAALRTTMIARGGSCVVLDAPPAIRETVDMWGDVGGIDLMRAVKHQFDPHDRLAPGRFVGGI
jgi:glycolate oxidase FAD binding subunit